MSTPPDDDLMMRPQGISGVAAFVIGVVAFGVGLGVGGELGMYMKEPEIKIVEKPRDLNAEELNAACAPLLQTADAKMEEVTAKVTDLQGQVASRESEVAELEAKVKQGAKLSADQARRLDEAKKELGSLKRQLEQAESEKAQLIVQLAETQTKLDGQVVETEKAKGDATTQRWFTFAKDAQITICEKGNRKVLGKCRDIVDTTVSKFRTDFERCVRTGQEQPSLKESTKGERLPEFARWLDNDDKVTKGWYILLCDPTLPEAGTVEPPQL